MSIGFLRPADKGLNILNAFGIGGGNHLGHFDNPMSLHLAINIVIINPFQVIGKPLIFDCQQPEEGGLSCALSSDQTEHGFKLASRLEYPADCAQHEQPQTFIGELAFLRSKKMGQGAADALGAVPFQTVQIVTDGMVLVAVSQFYSPLNIAVTFIINQFS